MCGIIGYSNLEASQEDIATLERVLVESRIRGKHASGLAWYDYTKDKIRSHITNLSVDKMLEDFDMFCMMSEGRISMIAHTRYSTSNLSYNQPLLGKNLAIAHNGVITQLHPKYWQDEYGYTCEGKNDSELILRALENGDDPFMKFPDASIAYVWMDGLGTVGGIRNGKRPLWKGKIGEGTVYASTYDILQRAGVKKITKLPAVDDLQERDVTGWTT